MEPNLWNKVMMGTSDKINYPQKMCSPRNSLNIVMDVIYRIDNF